MPDFVRVKCQSTGHEKSIPADAPRRGWDELDKPATRPDGTPLPDKAHKSLSSKPNPTGQTAATKKENS